jgi:uncharacterized membrane protein
MRRLRVLRHVRSSLWFVPVVCVLGGMLLSFLTIAVDGALDYSLVPEAFTGGPDAAVAILSTVAASMVSLTALVLTITMVVVQLAMGQFSPRIVQTILQDKPSQFAIGLFVATFAHAMLALREVRFEDGGQVPGLAILVAYLLIVVSIVVLVMYVHHIGKSLRVASLIELVGSATRDLLDQQYEDGGTGQPRPDRCILAPHSGVLSHIGHEELVEIARDGDCRLELCPALGEFVPAGAPLFRIEGRHDRVDHDRAADAVVIGLERSLADDPAYGLRLLVDIAERSLAESPFLDPTTAVQAIDRLHDCLRQLACRRFPDGTHRDRDGDVRLVVPTMDWDAYVRLAFAEIRLAGARSPQVTRRLRAAFDDLLTVAPPDRRAVLVEQKDALDAAMETASEPLDADLATRADRQGLGAALSPRR